MERWNISRTHVKFYNKVQVAATYTAPLSLLNHPTTTATTTTNQNEKFKALVYSALSETLKRQPIMSVAIQDEGSQEPKWKRVSKIDLDELVTIIDQDPLANSDSWILEGHAAFLDRVDEVPLWRIRVAVLPSDLRGENRTFSFTVAFYFHHAIGDGISGGAFHLTFLSALNHLLSNPTSVSPNSLIPVPKLDLIPTLEMGTPLGFTVFFVFKQIIKAFLWSPADSKKWAGPDIKNPPTLPAIGDQKSFEVEPEMVKKLVKKCRDENTTITALVAVLAARKVAVMNPSYSHFAGTIPFSLRKFTGHSMRDMGNFVSNVVPHFSSEEKTPRGYISCVSPSVPSAIGKDFKDEHEHQDKTLWNSARETKAFILANTASPDNQMVGLLKFVSDIVGFFNKKFGQRREFAFEITNIGVLDGGVDAGKEEERVTFDKVSFSGSICTYAEPFGISLATAKNGFMTVAMRWEVGVTSKEDGKEMAGWLEGSLRALGGV